MHADFGYLTGGDHAKHQPGASGLHRAEGEVAQSRAEEDASGRSRAYLTEYAADEVINWNYDEAGRLDWVVIRTSCLQQSKVTDEKWERETRWIYYDRENYQVFRKTGEAQE